MRKSSSTTGAGGVIHRLAKELMIATAMVFGFLILFEVIVMWFILSPPLPQIIYGTGIATVALYIVTELTQEKE